MAGTAPETPTEVHARGWWHVLKRTVREFIADELMDRAAALTYYALLSLFPAVIVLVALLGLLGREPGTTDALLDIVRQVGSAEAAEAVRGPIEDVIAQKGGAGALFGVGLLGAIWAASGYIGAFTRAGNAIWEVDEGRPFWRLKPVQIVITLLLVLMVAVIALALTLTGSVARAVGDAIGLGDTAVTAWDIAKWPVMLLIVILTVAMLYWLTPNVRRPRFRWISPGAAVAIVAWIVASVGFAIYVSNFGNYNATYGSLGAVVVLLLWLWITNLALLLGAQFDAELERERELMGGVPAAEERIQLPERHPPKDRRAST
jgi:membrane protein